MENWISVKDNPPKIPGEYKVKTNHGNSIAFLARNLSGSLTWLCVNEDHEVTHYLSNQ
jgi:hypothetical protein